MVLRNRRLVSMLCLEEYTSFPLNEQKRETAYFKLCHEEKRAEKPQEREEQESGEKTGHAATREVCSIKYAHATFERAVGLTDARGHGKLHANEDSGNE